MNYVLMGEMTMKRKIMILLLAVLLLIAGCSDEEKNDDPPKEANLSICYSEDYTDSDEYEEFVADMTAPTEVVIATDSSVSFLAVLKLTYEEFEGEMMFAAEEIYGLKYFEPEKPLRLTITDYGTIPSYGISYIDSCGEKHSFAITVSGYDGSVVLEEIEISMG